MTRPVRFDGDWADPEARGSRQIGPYIWPILKSETVPVDTLSSTAWLRSQGKGGSRPSQDVRGRFALCGNHVNAASYGFAIDWTDIEALSSMQEMGRLNLVEKRNVIRGGKVPGATPKGDKGREFVVTLQETLSKRSKHLSWRGHRAQTSAIPS